MSNNKDQKFYIVLSEIQAEHLQSILDYATWFEDDEHVENLKQQVNSIVDKIDVEFA